MRSFRDRRDAGRLLGRELRAMHEAEPVVLALPRGGVPVAAEVAEALGAPLDVALVRRLLLPQQPEVAFGAIGEGGVRVVDRDVVARAGLSEAAVARAVSTEQAELDRRIARYRGALEPVPLSGRTVVVVDDGLATGATARAAVQVARARGARRVVLAAPVAPRSTIDALRADADEVVILVEQPDLVAVSHAYEDFGQVGDAEVAVELAASGTARRPVPAAAAERDVTIDADGSRLAGHLAVPRDATGVVVFAHGSGSSRHSPRDRRTARTLAERGIGSLRFDLLTAAEAADPRREIDVALLGGRLLAATRWLRAEPDTSDLPFGYLGVETGAAVALWAAAEPGNLVRAVVSRGGRAELTGERIGFVRCPVLLVVGDVEADVLASSRRAAQGLRCLHQVAEVPGATRRFEEPGALDDVADLAVAWFDRFLVPERRDLAATAEATA